MDEPTGCASENVVSRDEPRRASGRPRPLLLPAVGFMAGIAAAEVLGNRANPALAATGALPLLAVVLFLSLRRCANSALFACAPVVIVAIALGFIRHQAAIDLPPQHIAHFTGHERTLTCLAGQVVTTPVTQPPERRNPYLPFDPPSKTRFVLAVTESRATTPPQPLTGYVRVSIESNALNLRVGHIVQLSGWLYRPLGPRNPGAPDWARSQRLQGIYAGLSVEGPQYVKRLGKSTSLHRRISIWLRGYVRGFLFEPHAHAEADQATRLLDTMVLGQRSAATRELNEAFIRTGSVHFLAVSGFHVGILAMSTWYLVRRLLRRSTTAASCVTIAVLLTYAFIAEHNAPILRATIMGVLVCLALLSSRPICAINWLSMSALCILFVSPLELFRPGFQLSFVTVLALVAIVPRLYRRATRLRSDGPPPDAETVRALLRQRLWRWTLGLAIVSVVAWLASMPLIIYHFGRFSPLGAFHCVVLSPLVIVTVLLGFVTVITTLAFPPLGAAVGVLLRGATSALLAIVNALSQLPGTLVEVRSPPVWLVFLSYGLLLTVVWLWRICVQVTNDGSGHRRRRMLVVAVVLVGFLIWPGWYIRPSLKTADSYELHVLSVGSGSATLLLVPDRNAALFDAGTMHNIDVGVTVNNALRASEIRRLDFLTISHANFDHYSGVHTLLRSHPTRLYSNSYLPRARATKAGVQRLFRLLPADTPTPTTLNVGDTLALNDATIDVLWPEAGLDDWNANDRSLVLRLTVHGRTLLIPGDIERAAITALLTAEREGRVVLNSDVLIAPHHGSIAGRATAEFLTAVAPQAVLVSTAKPRPKFVALVRETLGPTCRVISTRDVGAVKICITPVGELTIHAPFAEWPRLP